VADRYVQVRGEAAYVADYAAGPHHRDARPARIYENTTQTNNRHRPPRVRAAEAAG